MNTKNTIPAVLVVVALTACAPAPAPVQAWKTLDGIAVAVDTAMKASGDLYRAGKITEAQKAEIVKAYDVYRPLAQVAHAAIKTWAIQDPNAVETPRDVSKAISDLRAAADGVLAAAKRSGVQ